VGDAGLNLGPGERFRIKFRYRRNRYAQVWISQVWA